MRQAMTEMQVWMTMYGLKAAAALAILVLGYFASRIVRGIVKRVLRKSGVDDTLVLFSGSLVYVGLMILVVVAAIGELGVQTTSFVAILGAAGLAVGLALQGSLSNFASGILMIVFKPFRVGDFISAAGTSGTVEEIGIFTTSLKSPDNTKIIVPNAKITNDNIINYTAKAVRRIDIIAGVSYDDNLDKVKTILKGILDSDERILRDPAPVIGVLELADSSVNVAVRPWVSTSDYWDVFFALQERIKKRFDEEGISIPFPQHDVHLHRED